MNVRLEGNWKFLNTPSLVNFERRAIGYDRLFKRIIDMPENDNQSYPPHNLIKESDTEFRIELALAGFSKKEVRVVQEEQRLTISGNNSEKEDQENILHKGIASRAFTKIFYLAETIEVTEASFENGMVIIKLRQNIPEDKKPKLIELK
jgi:molecular chaperone IbpA